MTKVHTIASGSSGNALVFSWDGGRLLLDAGISCRRILSALGSLGLTAADLDGILITHTHGDHVSGLQTLLKRTDCPVYASERACRELDYRFAGIRDRLFPLHPGGCVVLDGNGDVCAEANAGVEANENGTFPANSVVNSPVQGGLCRITAVSASHDAPGTCGWRLDTADGGFAFLTDTGIVTEEAKSLLPGARFVLLEANYDMESLRSGPYPLSLKQRVAGPLGHLCNEEAGVFAAELARAGAERIVLAHLSRENNTPAMAETAVRQALDASGVSLAVVPRDGVWLAYAADAASEVPGGEAALCGG